MDTRHEQEHPDWVVPAVLAAVGAVVVLVLIVTFVVRSKAAEGQTLAGQMERWTSCLRSEGAAVPLVEATGDDGFRITFDAQALDSDLDGFFVAFDQCLDDAPESVQTIASVIDGLSSLPFGGDDFGWLGPLLFEFGDSDMFGDSGMGGPPIGDPPLYELCAQLSDLQLVVPEVASELSELCASHPDV